MMRAMKIPACSVELRVSSDKNGTLRLAFSVILAVESPESAELSVPHALLEAAGIPLDDDLDIRCEDGAIIIGSADPVKQLPPQLMELFDSLGVNHDTICCVLEGGGEDEE